MMKKSKIRLPEMKDYYSIRHATSNENGVEEIELEIRLTPWEKWMYSIKYFTLTVPETRTNVYVAKGPYWVDKETGMIPDETTQYECYEAKAWLRLNRLLEK